MIMLLPRGLFFDKLKSDKVRIKTDKEKMRFCGIDDTYIPTKNKLCPICGGLTVEAKKQREKKANETKLERYADHGL